MEKGIFITFEGVDGCGKTTQLELMAKYLKEKNIEYIKTREPGATDLGADLRKILLHYEKPVSDTAESFLYLADRAQHVEFEIKPALENKKIVLCDRFTDSTIAYQGYGRNQDIQTLEKLNNIATGGLMPDLTIVFDINPELAQMRLGGEKDRLEKEGLEFHKKLRQGYIELSKKFPDRIKLVNADDTIQNIHKNCIKLISGYIV